MTETKFAMVSDWMTNGNINEFVGANPDADRLKLVGPHHFTLIASSSLTIEITHLAGGRC